MSPNMKRIKLLVSDLSQTTRKLHPYDRALSSPLQMSILACPVDVPLDMIFLLDTSDKISSAGFEYMKNLVITTASILKMSGYESTRLAVFQFSAQGSYFRPGDLLCPKYV